jgi:uncharacterized protein (TIGR02246 family)
MRTSLLSLGLLTAILLLASASVQSRSDSANPPVLAKNQDQEKVAGAPVADRSTDEAAIRANVAAFVKAYNARDSKAVAALFTADGQIEGKDGSKTDGRQGIEKTFADLFAGKPNNRIEVTVESIRFIGSELAVEVGTTKETPGPAEPPEYDRYTVLHVKRDGKWQMALARDEEGPAPTGHERLEPLAWLLGDWLDDGGSTVVNSSCRWSPDGNFLLQDFKLQVNGRDSMTVSQRIGWDPSTKCIHSWTFDSEGGFGESLWTQKGDTWIIKATGVRPDGSKASATNFLMRSGKDAYVWRSTDRILGDQSAPSTDVKVVRKPPQPR